MLQLVLILIPVLVLLWLTAVLDQTSDNSVICNLQEFFRCEGAIICVLREEQWGDNTPLVGAGIYGPCEGEDTPQPVMSFRCFSNSCSKDFMTIDVRVSGLLSFNPMMVRFLGTGMIVELLKQEEPHTAPDTC
ncbi:hypothetical protein ILYODFUR_032819 [Ilyodon furcidens]|uniref:Uncharacterized protein n=1 Tax=Ilyodon furcidens TaxID=33524 RepID=A0ABV0UPZ5_9TELE